MSNPSDIDVLKKRIAVLEAENKALYKELNIYRNENKNSDSSTVAQNEKQAEKALKREKLISEELARSDVYKMAILNNSDQIFALIDASYKILFANKRAQEQATYIRKKAFEPGLSALTLVPQGHTDTFKERFRKAFNGDTIEDIRSFKYFDTWQWFKYRYTPAYNKAGKVFAVSFSAIEITDIKKKEEDLKTVLKNEQKLIANIQENEWFLNSIIDNLPIGFQLYDKNGYSIRMNEKQRELLGTGSVDYAVQEFNILEDRMMKESGISQVFKKAYRGETINNFETEVNFGSPENQWETHRFKKYYSITVCPLFDTDRQISAVACLTQDITDRKLADRALMESKKDLEEAQEFGRLGTWRMDLQTQKIEWSKQVFASFGLDPEGKVPSYEEYQKMIHPDDWKKLFQKVEDTIAKGTIYEMEMRHRQPDGSYRWMYVKGKPDYNDARQITGISGINFDIDSRKQAEIKMKESLEKLQMMNRELQKANSELDRFVYSASHDLRAPIASVLGLIELCKSTADPDVLKDYFSKQELSIKKLDNFIREILDYSRNARMDIESTPIDFRKTLEDIFGQYDYQENSKDIHKVLKIDQPSTFFSDQRRLNVIFNNLISNAIRYSDPWKPQPQIKVKVTTTSQEAHIIFSDNGQGIGEAHVNKVFEMFYRGNETKSGSGLGLYIVSEAVDKLCGTVSLTSELGMGTTITLKIPNTPPDV